MRFLVAAAVIGFLLLNWLPLWLFRASRRLQQRGWHRCAFLLSQMSTPLCIPRLYRAEIAAHFELCRLRETGRIEDAARLASRTAASGVFLADSINYVIDILVSAGAYRASLEVGAIHIVALNSRDLVNLSLIQINLAEAEYNLGLWDDAEARLRELDHACAGWPIARAGLLVQRAWIAAHLGGTREAIDLCAAVDEEWFPESYRAEHHFCMAAALLSGGRLDEAEAALERGRRVSIRLSSKRNALFLSARIAAARADWTAAERDCRAAAEHPHRGQGGDGFVLWAEALRKLGRDAEAEEALRLLLERDPECEAAQRALPLKAQGA